VTVAPAVAPSWGQVSAELGPLCLWLLGCAIVLSVCGLRVEAVVPVPQFSSDLDALREYRRTVTATDALFRKKDVTTSVESGGHTPLTLSLCPSQEEFEKALVWYESTLKLQPEFVPAKNRIQTIQCHLMLKKGRRSP